MGIVKSEITVDAEPRKVFDIAREVEKYPEFMPDVKDIKVLERRDDGFSRVAWVAHAKVASIDKDIKWVEDENWNYETLSNKFELVEGDYKHYSGTWDFLPEGDGTRMVMEIDYDLGLPLIGPLIVKLLDKIMQNNLDGMLKAIKERTESIT